MVELEIKVEENRVYIEDENHFLLGEVTFPNIDVNTVDINHTYVHESLRGQGIGGKLLDKAMEVIKNSNRNYILTCSMAIKRFSK